MWIIELQTNLASRKVVHISLRLLRALAIMAMLLSTRDFLLDLSITPGQTSVELV